MFVPTPSKRRATAATAATPAAPASASALLPPLVSTPLKSASSTPARLFPSTPTQSAHAAVLSNGGGGSGAVAAASAAAAVLERSERHTISVAGAWPDKLWQHLGASAAPQGACIIEPNSSAVLLIHSASNSCFHWVLRRPNETLRRFQLPAASFAAATGTVSHLVCLTNVASGINGMGLLACSADGRFRYWEKISITGADSYIEMNARLDLRPENPGAALVACDPAGYVLVTRNLSLYRISLTNAIGETALSYAALTRPVSSVFSRFGSLIWGSSSTGAAASVSNEFVAATVGATRVDANASRDIFVLGQKTLQRWEVSGVYSEKFHFEEDISKLIEDVLQDNFELAPVQLAPLSATSSSANVLLLGMDALKLQPPNRAYVATLVVFAIHNPNVVGGQCLRYCIATLDATSSPVQLVHLTHLEHRVNYSPLDSSLSRLVADARLIVYNGTASAFVSTASFYALTSVVKSAESKVYDVTVTTTDDRSRLVGTDCDHVQLTNVTDRETWSSFYSLDLQHGVLKLDQRIPAFIVAPPQSSASSANASAGATVNLAVVEEKMRSKLEVFVLSTIPGREESPLVGFTPHEIELCLDSAVDSVSQALVSSTSKALPSVLDLKLQLSTKLERLTRLLRAIHANGGVLQLMSTTRHALFQRVEKLAVAAALWNHQNNLFKSADWKSVASNRSHAGLVPGQLLYRSLLLFANEVLVPADVTDEERLRRLFQTKVEDFDVRLIKTLQKLVQERQSFVSAEQQLDLFRELNTIVLTLMDAAHKMRKEMARLFGNEAINTDEQSWTATDDVIDVFQLQLQLTDAVLQRSRPHMADAMLDATDPEVERRNVVLEQLVQIAELLLTSYEGLLLFHYKAGNQIDYESLSQRYQTYRPKALDSLCAHGRRSNAINMAEQFVLPLVNLFTSKQAQTELDTDQIASFPDLSTLATLCTPANGMDDVELQNARALFMSKYQVAFAFPYFRRLIEQKQRARLLTDPLRLTKFIVPLREGGELRSDVLTMFLRYTVTTDNDQAVPCRDIQWIHVLDPAIGAQTVEQVIEASTVLLDAVESQEQLAARKTMVSVAKLLALVDREPSDDSASHLLKLKAHQTIIHAQEVLHELGDNVVTFVPDRPFDAELIETGLRKFKAGRSLFVWHLVSILTSIPVAFGKTAKGVTLGCTFFGRATVLLTSAVQIGLADEITALFLQQLIQRRLFLVDDWTTHLEGAINDEDKAAILAKTAVARVLAQTPTVKPLLAQVVDEPSVLKDAISVELLAKLVPSFTMSQLDAWQRELAQEQAKVDHLLQSGRVLEYVHFLLQQGDEPGHDDEGDDDDDNNEDDEDEESMDITEAFPSSMDR